MDDACGDAPIPEDAFDADGEVDEADVRTHAAAAAAQASTQASPCAFEHVR
jgi:hypothetical protein